MESVLKRIGFKPGAVWYKIYPRKSESQLEGQWKALLGDLRAGVASIVCMRYDGRPGETNYAAQDDCSTLPENFLESVFWLAAPVFLPGLSF